MLKGFFQMPHDLNFDSAVVLNEPCYFCSGGQLIGFNEHYIFCSNCSAIYTNMIIHEHECDHIIKDKTPVAIREPWFESARNEKTYLIETEDQPGFTHACSECWSYATADGW